MRELKQHHTNSANEALKITVLDEPGAGGAHHLYLIHGFNASRNQSFDLELDGIGAEQVAVLFQNGPIKEVGVNGITHEALLAILIDRLKAFQAGPYECKPNGLALDCLEQALTHLHSRTLERQARGVEGTHGL